MIQIHYLWEEKVLVKNIKTLLMMQNWNELK